MSFEAHHLTVPAVRWLGLLPSDYVRLVLFLKNCFITHLALPQKTKAKTTMNLPKFPHAFYKLYLAQNTKSQLQFTQIHLSPRQAQNVLSNYKN